MFDDYGDPDAMLDNATKFQVEDEENEVEFKVAHIREFQRCVRKLNAIMDEIHKYCPKANYYLANDNLNLMRGPSHSDDGGQHQENVVASELLAGSGGGDW